MSRKKIKIGVVGCGGFSKCFIGLFKSHPDVGEVALCDLDEKKLNEKATTFGITRLYHSLDEMLKEGKDIDCVAIMTQRHLHGPMVLAALEAGKHIYSAVPIATGIGEIEKIVDKVKQTGLVYMMGETCYYFPDSMFCRERYKRGDFGRFVYGEAQYYHDMSEFENAFRSSDGDNWRKPAGIPPMYYCTHSIGMLFSACGEHATSVSCFGYEDPIGDGIFGKGNNYWDNPFSNETAIFRMSGGGLARINEFRRIGVNKPSSYITAFYGDLGGFEHSFTQYVFERGPAANKKYRGDDDAVHAEYLDEYLNPARYVEDKQNGTIDYRHKIITPRYTEGFSAIHDVTRLPKALREIRPTGHHNSHPFLVDDFVRAVMEDKLPPNNAWEAARYMIPGIIAHESALKGGVSLEIPDLGDAPASFERLEYVKKDYYEEEKEE